jgi:hypothetical protein
MRSATGAHNQELVGAPDQGAGSSGPPDTESLAVGRPLGSIQHMEAAQISADFSRNLTIFLEIGQFGGVRFLQSRLN